MKNGGEKKSITVLYLVKKILYGGFKFSKINFSFAFRKKNKLVTKREKKVRCASAVSKVIFVFPL